MATQQDDKIPSAAYKVLESARQQTILENPLSQFSSYTYNASLYIVPPETINKFAAFGKLQSNDIYYIVAQSGGLSKTDPRALTNIGTPSTLPGVDYYIDDLSIENVMPLHKSAPTAYTSVSFKIIEPLGFTFLTKLSEASNYINKISGIIGSTSLQSRPNLFQQHYILGIRFYGYDSAGNLVNSAKTNKSWQKTPQSGNMSTIGGDAYANFEVFYPLVVGQVNYKLNGGPTVYDFSANYLNLQAAYAAKRGLIKKDITIIASTVGEAIKGSSNTKSSVKGLIQILNEDEADKKDTGLSTSKNIYMVEFKNPQIEKSQLVTTNDLDLRQVPANGGNNQTDSNVIAATKATSISISQRETIIKAGNPIISIIDNIITKSTYVTNKLKINDSSRAEAKVEDQNRQNNAQLNWFSIIPSIKVLKRDQTLQDWVYEIKYIIDEYKIPYMRFPYKSGSPQYVGPVKEYNYFLTGKNTEIISFEQNYDNHWYIINTTTTEASLNPNPANVKGPIANQGGSPPGSSTGGDLGKGNTTATAARASLSSIADQAKAEMKILGDPSYLMPVLALPPLINYQNASSFYAKDGFTINPLQGQIFIEIVFNLATDYNEKGLLNVSNNISFYDDVRVKKQGIKGLVYRVDGVISNFSNGVFTQTLDLTLIPKELLTIRENETTRQQAADATTTARESTTTVSQTSNDINVGYSDSTIAQNGRAIANSANDDAQIQIGLNTLPDAERIDGNIG